MIWCVEDDASIRDIEVYTLQSTGFQAQGFEDGISFWQALQHEIPELVVLDIMLPGMDGITILKKMKEKSEFKDIPVILATNDEPTDPREPTIYPSSLDFHTNF